MRQVTTWRWAAVATALVVVLAGCASADDLAGSSADPETAAPSASATAGSGGLSAFYGQKLDWKGCGNGTQCATVTVPVDYAEPDGETLELAVRKRPASNQDDKLGTMFINPGGPGGSGVSYVEQFTGKVSRGILDSYDVMGFDPRGVGKSTPLTCFDTERLDEFVNSDPTPDTDQEKQELYDESAALGQACLDNSGDLAKHVSTIEVAKDLDVLRALAGDDDLTYVGASYGTQIGATYAELFPKEVGRMVLDGALDPNMTAKEANLGQSEGFQRALEAYVEDCIAKSSCPLGQDKQAGLDKISDFLDGLDQKPLDSGDPDRPVTEALGFYGIAITLYNEAYWPYLSQELQAAFTGDGAPMLSLADQYLDRGANGYTDNSSEVIYAVNCLDTYDTTTIAEAEASVPEFTKVSPVLGRAFVWSPVSCTAWPIKPSLEQLDIDGSGAAPIVVVGTTRDPATPYEWSQAMASDLDSGVLVSRDGDGHTGYNMGNACVDDAVNGYLLDGDVPEDGLSC